MGSVASLNLLDIISACVFQVRQMVGQVVAALQEAGVVTKLLAALTKFLDNPLPEAYKEGQERPW